MRPHRWLPALLALALVLTGCSAMLERDYTSITPHNAAPTTEGDPSTLRADSYQELVNALIYFVDNGVEEGTVRLYFDSEDVETDLEVACLEVVQEDPLGAYAVEFIKFRVTRVVTYAQADVYFTYRRTPEQVDSIVQATGVTAIREELEDTLASFSPECVLRISYFDGDEETIRSLAQEAYYHVPEAAFGMPELEIALYPETGRQRIVEVLLTYPDEPAQLEDQKEALARRLDELAAPLAGVEGDALILAAGRTLLSAAGYSPEGPSDAYGLLETGEGDSEGFALAYAALGERLGLSCRIAQGTWRGAPHFWNVVRTADGWRHLDLSATSGALPSLRTDPQMSEGGYQWEADSVPACLPVQTEG